MPSELDEFRNLLRRVCEGSDEAAWQLVERYGEALRRAVRRALDRRLRSKFDSLDFVQLVWSSFFRTRARAKQFARPEDLAAFLCTMARNKVGMETRRRLKDGKFAVNREFSLQEIDNPDHAAVAAREPAPDEVAIARELWNRIIHDKPEHYRDIVCMKMQGHTCKSIACSLRLAPCTVRRFLNKLCGEMSRPQTGLSRR